MHKITEDSGGFPNMKPLYYTTQSFHWQVGMWTVVCTWIKSSCGPKQNLRYQRKTWWVSSDSLKKHKKKNIRGFWTWDKHPSHSHSGFREPQKTPKNKVNDQIRGSSHLVKPSTICSKICNQVVIPAIFTTQFWMEVENPENRHQFWVWRISSLDFFHWCICVNL